MKMFYVERSASGKVGNCLLWWRTGGNGYTCDIADAEKFSQDDPHLAEILRSSKYTVWPAEYIDDRTTLHVDHQKLDLSMIAT